MGEEGVAAQRMTVEEIYDAIAIRMAWLNRGGQLQCDDLAKTIGLKRLRILFKLEYWKVNIYTCM
jgi:hypothetical protein